MGSSPRIGITIGDPAGIGPEITLKALSQLTDQHFTPVIISRKAVLEQVQQGSTAGFVISDSTDQLRRSLADNAGRTHLFDVALDFPLPSPGRGTIETGMESRTCIDTAIRLWKERLIDAVVTGPVHKALIEKTGCTFTGHTEYIADAIGETNPFMMMFSREYRVLLATTHMPISAVPAALTPDRLLMTIRTGHAAMTAIDGGRVKLAITGLDPHCGDEGAINDFDMRVTAEAVARARSEGIDIEGPLSADTLFMPEKWKRYNLVIVHYHDQGLIPFKMLAFDEGVNVTLGLSIIRTSVDHGTAFDIAGKGMAQYTSMVEAIKVAMSLHAMRK